MSDISGESGQSADRERSGNRPFRWDYFMGCILSGGLAVFVTGIFLDNILQMFNIGISSWQEAAWSAAFSVIFSTPIAFAFWRLGLLSLPQYLLGATGLFVPLTILSTLIMYVFWDIKITVPDFDSDTQASQIWALTAYIRIARSALFVPSFLLTFWFMFHRVCRMEPRR